MRLRSSSLTSPSSPPVRFLAAARFNSTAPMASRPHYRGGRYRGYCDRSAVGEGENVAGNSHFHQGRGSNLGFRHVDGSGGYVDRSYDYNNVFSNGQFVPRQQFQHYRPAQFQENRPPYYRQNQGFDGRPVYNSYNAPMNMNTQPGSMMGSSYGGHRPEVSANPRRGQPNQFRPRNSKPLDFREWEYVKPEPPRHWERFTILSYNILADYLANEHWRKLYFHIPRHMLSWEWRKNNIFYELRLWSPDIMCFQEVDRFQDLYVEFKRQGYDGIYKMRTGNPVDGCSIFWRTSKFKLLHEENIEFNNLGLRDNVAQICVLESVQLDLRENPTASDTRSEGPNRVIVCNIHVLYNPKRGDIKLGQVRVLLDKANDVSKNWNNAPVVVCGDFNCTPKSPIYNYISEKKLDLSGLAKDKLSGQASAEIQAPIFHRPSPGFQPSIMHALLNSDIEKSDSHSDSQKHIITSGTVGDSQGQPELANADELNGSRMLEEEPSSGKIETDISGGGSLDKISTSDRSSDITLNMEYNIHQGAEKCVHATVTDLPISNSYTSDTSCFENIFEEPVKSLGENKDSGEDGETFLSELTGDSVYSDYSQLGTTIPVEEQQVQITSPESEPSSLVRTGYNPSRWSQTEIETATGTVDSTYLEHPLQLRSTYTETEDLLGTRDGNGEPLITSYHRCFCGTVDYIWRSEGLQTVKVLSPMRKQAMQWTAGFPTKKWGSDHIALVAQLAFVPRSQEDQRD